MFCKTDCLIPNVQRSHLHSGTKYSLNHQKNSSSCHKPSLHPSQSHSKTRSPSKSFIAPQASRKSLKPHSCLGERNDEFLALILAKTLDSTTTPTSLDTNGTSPKELRKAVLSWDPRPTARGTVDRDLDFVVAAEAADEGFRAWDGLAGDCQQLFMRLKVGKEILTKSQVQPQKLLMAWTMSEFVLRHIWTSDSAKAPAKSARKATRK